MADGAPMADQVAPQDEPVTEFGKRNPHLAALVPDAIEDAVDAIMPDALEKVLDKGCEKVYAKYQNFRTDMAEGVGEVAAVLLRVAKYAYERFHIHDLVFGVYHLALHHATVNAADEVEGKPVRDQELITFLMQATDAANAAYCPERKELAEAAGVPEEAVLVFEPVTTTTRPAYAVWEDKERRRLVWGFRGTTDLNDMLTDACASCTPYCDGYAHWGMLEAARWFADNELAKVKSLLDERPGWELLLVGHSLGAGTAAMLAHLIKNDEATAELMRGVSLRAVGVATPAVLTEEMANSCGDYVTSVVLQHDMVPRFSIHNVFQLKEEMDATDWGQILINTAKDWAVPDVIERSATYQRLSKRVAESTEKHWSGLATYAARGWLALTSWAVSTLHFWGLAKPNPEVQHGGHATGMRGAAAATAATARAAVNDPRVVAEAVQGVSDQVGKVAQEDVHRVYAPGRLFFIKRLDKHKGRAKYGNMEHRCVLCENDVIEPEPGASDDEQQQQQQQGAAKDAPAEFYPGARFELIEAAPRQRFGRIVLRETCLLDHLTGGYIQGLRYALDKAQGRAA